MSDRERTVAMATICGQARRFEVWHTNVWEVWHKNVWEVWHTNVWEAWHTYEGRSGAVQQSGCRNSGSAAAA